MQKPKPYFCGIFETFNQQPSCAVEMDKRSIFIRLRVSFLPFCTSNVSLKLIIYVCYPYTFEKWPTTDKMIFYSDIMYFIKCNAFKPKKEYGHMKSRQDINIANANVFYNL